MQASATGCRNSEAVLRYERMVQEAAETLALTVDRNASERIAVAVD